MRAFSTIFIGAVLALCVPSTIIRAEDYSTVPTTLAAIGDATLRDALSRFSPNYNYLEPAAQYSAYSSAYESVYGIEPASVAQDSLLEPQPIYAVQPEPEVVYDMPPAYYEDPGEDFLFGPRIGSGDE